MKNTQLPRTSIGKVLDPILLNDPILGQLKYLDELNVSNLISLTGDPRNSVTNTYKTELLIHCSYLMQKFPHLSRQQLADNLDYSKDNLNRNINIYQLPQHFGRSSTRILMRKYKKQHGMKSEHVYNRHKITLLYQIHSDRKGGMNLKEVAKSSDMPYQKTRDWVRQYKIKELKVIPKSHKKKIISPQLLSKNSSKELIFRKMTVHKATRLITETGKVVYATDLVENKKLLDRKFLMYDVELNQFLGRIRLAKYVISKRNYIKTTAGSCVITGAFTRFIVDRKKGLLRESVNNIQKEDGLIAARHLSHLQYVKPSIYSLLKPVDGDPEIEFTLDPSLRSKIVVRLQDRFGSLKKAAKCLGVKYKRGLSGTGFTHSILNRVYDELNFPNIHHPQFMNYVKTVRYKIQGGRHINVNHFLLEEDLLYILGLIASDGYASKDRNSAAAFYNEVHELVSLFKSILIKYFPSLTANIRPKTDHRSTYECAISHYPIRILLHNLEIKGPHVNANRTYLPIVEMEFKLIAAFLQGLFDGDGTVDVNARKIGFAVFHPQRAKNTVLLLKRMNIDCWIYYSHQTKLKPPGAKEAKDSHQWNVYISGKKDLLKFMKYISSRHPDKKRRLNKLKQIIKNRSSLSSKYNRAPLHSVILFRKVRMEAGIPQDKIWKRSVWDYENYQTRPSITRVNTYVEKMIKFGIDIKSKVFQKLQKYLNPVYNIEPVKKMKELKKGKMILLEVEAPLVTDIGLVLDGKHIE